MTVQKVENDLFLLLNSGETDLPEDSETKQLDDSKYVRHFASQIEAKPMASETDIQQKIDSSTQEEAHLIPNQKNKQLCSNMELSKEDLKWLGKKNLNLSKENRLRDVSSHISSVKPVDNVYSHQDVVVQTQKQELHHKAKYLLNKITNQEKILESKLADMSLVSNSTSSLSNFVDLPLRCICPPNNEQRDEGNEIREESLSSDIFKSISLPDSDWFSQLLKNELEM